MTLRLFLLLASLTACTVKPPGAETTDATATAAAVGDCKSTPDGPITDTAGYTPTFSMTAVASGDTVLLHLIDVAANCCPSPGASYTVEGSVLNVVFEDVTEETSCDCMCVFDFDVTLLAVPAGTWTVELHDGGELLGTTSVTVL